MVSLSSLSLLGKKVEPKEWESTWERWMSSDFVPSNRKVMELMDEAYQDGLSVGRNSIIELIQDVAPHAPEEHKEVFEGILDAIEELYGKDN